MPLLNKTELKELKTKKLFKITNKNELHFDLQYKDGLNEDILEFNPSGFCESGGLYFFELKYLSDFIHMGPWIREVTIPNDEPVYLDPFGDKYKVHRIILGKRRKLWTKSTFKYLIKLGWNINSNDDHVLRCATQNNNFKMIKFLLDNGANIHINDNYILRCVVINNNFKMVKFLIEHGVNIHTNDNEALRYAKSFNHIKILKYLESIIKQEKEGK